MKIIEDFIEELSGPDIVAGIVLNGPSVNKSALKQMEAKYPNIVALICICHCVSIFFKNVYKLKPLKTVYGSLKDTANKFRNVKWLRDKHKAVQREDPELKKLPCFKHPKGYTKDVATRFASKYDCTDRAVVVNPATKIVMNLPSYSSKYEERAAEQPADDSEDEFVRKDKRKLTEVLRDCKENWVLDKTSQKLASIILNELAPVKVLLPPLCSVLLFCFAVLFCHSTHFIRTSFSTGFLAYCRQRQAHGWEGVATVEHDTREAGCCFR